MVTLDPFFAGFNYYCKNKMRLKKNKKVRIGFHFSDESLRLLVSISRKHIKDVSREFHIFSFYSPKDKTGRLKENFPLMI